MWKTIKQFIIEEPKNIDMTWHTSPGRPPTTPEEFNLNTVDNSATMPLQVVDPAYEKIVQLALAHYCATCNLGFKTIGNATNHKRLKHKITK